MLACWSVGGGVGTSVLVAGLALADLRAEADPLVVDLCGDQPAIFGAPQPTSPGLAGWLAAGDDVPDGALARLEVEVLPGLAVLPRGSGDLDAARADSLVAALLAEDRPVLVDVGVPVPGSVGEHLASVADRSVLVVRACPLALRRLEDLPVPPTEVVVVRDRRRRVTWQAVASAVGIRVVAELELDPSVSAAVDAGLANRGLPRGLMRVLETVR